MGQDVFKHGLLLFSQRIERELIQVLGLDYAQHSCFGGYQPGKIMDLRAVPLDGLFQLCQSVASALHLLLREAAAPQGELKHVRAHVFDLRGHGLGDDPQPIDASQTERAIRLIDWKDAKGGVVIKGHNARNLAGTVHLVHHVGAVTVHVAGEEIQDLQVRQLRVHFTGGSKGLFIDVGKELFIALPAEIQTVGKFHEGALHLVAVLVQIFHVVGAGADIGQAQKIRHSAQSSVALVHPAAVHQAQVASVDRVGKALFHTPG